MNDKRMWPANWGQLARTLALALLHLSCTAPAKAPPSTSDAALEVVASSGDLGQAEATCLRGENPEELRLRLRSDCTTRGKLWTTLRSADDRDPPWYDERRVHNVTLPERKWRPVDVQLPAARPTNLREFQVHVQAYCVHDDEVLLLKQGDATCHL